MNKKAITHLLDTSVYSQPIKKRPLISVIEKWKGMGDSAFCTSIICEAEVLQGLEMKNSERLWKVYNEMLKDRIPILNLDLNIVKLYAKYQAVFRKKGKPRPVFDLLIACTAIEKNLVLATCNYKDFKDIDGLKVEDWSV